MRGFVKYITGLTSSVAAGMAIVMLFVVAGCSDGGKSPTGLDGKGGMALNVPVFGQNWDPWKTDLLGTHPTETIGSQGCAVASVAMLLKFYGADVDPRKLNDWLTANEGYIRQDEIIWDATDLYPGGVTFIGRVDWQKVDADLAQIDVELDGGYPVVAETRIGGSLHFVVLKGHEGTTYFMNDPWNGTGDVTFNARFGDPKRWIYGMRTYRQ